MLIQPRPLLLLLLVFLFLVFPLHSLEITDGSSHVVRVDAPPQAVASLTLMTDEFVSQLISPERIAAFSRSVDDPVLSNVGEVAKKVKGRTWLNLESLVKLKPDLILAADWSDAGDLDFLRQKGYSVYVIKTPRTWAQVKATIVDLAQVLYAQGAGKQLLATLAEKEAQLARIKAKVVKPVTVLEYNSFGSSMGVGTLWDDMTRMAGVTNLSSALPVDDYGYAPLSRELLVKLDPDWLVLPSPEALLSYGQAEFLQVLQKDPLYRGLKSVKAGQVLFLSEALKTSTSQAVLATAFSLQHAAYPDLR